MAVAFAALLASLSGTAVALPGKNRVDSGDIKKGAVKASDIAKNAVRGGNIKNDSLTGADIQESSLGTVPTANTAARRVLRALTPRRDDAGEAPQQPDPASRKLWALVERRLGRSGQAAATEQAAPTPEALKRLLRAAQQQGG